MEVLGNLIEEQLYVARVNGPCAYLPQRDSSLIFIDGHEVGSFYRLLLDIGYRRHGAYLYRPDCKSCQECRVLRIPIRYFCSQSQSAQGLEAWAKLLSPSHRFAYL